MTNQPYVYREPGWEIYLPGIGQGRMMIIYENLKYNLTFWAPPPPTVGPHADA